MDRQKRDNHHHDYYGGNSNNNYGGNSGRSHNWKDSYNMKSGGGFGDLITLSVVGVIIYAFYKTCIASNDEMGDRQYRYERKMSSARVSFANKVVVSI